MKKFSLLLFFLCFLLCSCSSAKSEKKYDTLKTEPMETSSSQPESNEHNYIGDFESDPVFIKLMEIESCTEPDSLCAILSELYDVDFNIVKLTHKTTNDSTANEYSGYEEPYDDFICSSHTLYNPSHPLSNIPISTDTYLFLQPRNETPLFIMDALGTYVVSDYDISQFDDGTHAHKVDSWVISDLYMCLHQFIDTDLETKNYLSEAVQYMDYYMDLEALVRDNLGGDIETQTPSLSSKKPNIEIISVEQQGVTSHDLIAKYRINNISNEPGVVVYTCTAHTFAESLNFNLDDFPNDFREDGYYEYDFSYSRGTDNISCLSIYYGYGDQSSSGSWEHNLFSYVYILYSEDYGTITSDTIPEDEIFPIYYEGEYIGAWTTHESADLYETHKNSDYIPFEQNNTFYSDSGDLVTVQLSGDIPQFTINGVYVGVPDETESLEDDMCYIIHYYDTYFFIIRTPHDKSIRIQGTHDIMSSTDVYLYP